MKRPMTMLMGAKRLAVAVGVACAAQGADAWDVEHDEIAQLTGEFLPREVKDFFDFDDFAILLANCHAPDMIGWPMADGTRRYATLDEVAVHVGAADAAVLKELGFDRAQWFHSPNSVEPRKRFAHTSTFKRPERQMCPSACGCPRINTNFTNPNGIRVDS